MILLGIGALLFVVLGSLEFAALDSVPPDLVDNAAVLGTLSLITAALFLLDLGGPRAKKEVEPPKTQKKVSKPLDDPNTNKETYHIEPELQRMERKELEALEEHSQRAKAAKEQSGQKNGHNGFGPKMSSQNGFKAAQNGYKKMKERDPERRFDIYGKDAVDYEHEKERDESMHVEKHSPVWSQIRKGQYGKYDVVVPSYLYPKADPGEYHQESQPSSPGDPGYVQYTAQRWGQPSQKTPRHSPTQPAEA